MKPPCTDNTPVPARRPGGGGRAGVQDMAQAPTAGAKRRRLDEEHAVLAGIKQRRTSEQTLVTCLTEHVERIDTDMVCPSLCSACGLQCQSTLVAIARPGMDATL